MCILSTILRLSRGYTIGLHRFSPSLKMALPTINITPAEAPATIEVSSDADAAAGKLHRARTAAAATYHALQLAVLDKLLATTPA